MKRLFLLAQIFFPLLVQAQSTGAPLCPVNQPCDSITVSSPSTTKDTKVLPITLLASPATGQSYSAPVVAGDGSLTFVLPNEIPDGTYNLQLKKGPPTGASGQQGDSITDLSPSQIVVKRPTITAVSPKGAFLDEKSTTNQVTVLGSGFRETKADKKAHNTLQFTDSRTPDPCDDKKKTDCYSLDFKSDREVAITFFGLNPDLDYFSGPKAFVLRVDGIPTNSDKLSLIHTHEGVPKELAFAGVGFILVALFFLIYTGRKGLKQQFGGKSYILSALFLDVQTQTYSLSKCQFYAWTLASALAYLFLVVSRSYVQGSATFPDIPSGLPGIILASAGTAIVSTGIAGAKGDKGAGEPGPSLSDFISSGGVVAADRLQFVVWTFIGIGTFLAIVFQSDPRDINDLPAIPSGFLQLMGISAAGYVAGKVVRKAGPVLTNLATSGTSNQLTFQLTGSGLSQSALFFIDDGQIFPDSITNSAGSSLPEIVQQDPAAGDNFARILKFSVKNPPASWFGKSQKFTITNPDAQKATIVFQIFKIDPATITINLQQKSLTMGGACLDKNLKVTITPTGTVQSIEVKPDDKTTPTSFVGTAELPANVGTVTVTVKDGPGMTFEQTGIKVSAPLP